MWLPTGLMWIAIEPNKRTSRWQALGTRCDIVCKIRSVFQPHAPNMPALLEFSAVFREKVMWHGGYNAVGLAFMLLLRVEGVLACDNPFLSWLFSLSQTSHLSFRQGQ